MTSLQARCYTVLIH